MLLRSVVGSFLSSLFVIGGLLAALSALDLTQVVLSILGLSAVVGLAVGFAFRDITENFIASVLLGMRRPFQIGDYVTVAGQSGVVKSLNTRATVLVTLEGRHVRIPNSVIFKEIMVNSTASPSFRNSFDVTIPIEASTRAAIERSRRPWPARRTSFTTRRRGRSWRPWSPAACGCGSISGRRRTGSTGSSSRATPS